MCRYQKEEVGPSCKGFVLVKFTPTERRGLVDMHNALRNKVALGGVDLQPGASNMRAMVWNEELAGIAERWASQCVYGYDICRDLGECYYYYYHRIRFSQKLDIPCLEKFPVGQNVAKGTYSTSNETELVNHWFLEHRNFDASLVAKYKITKRKKNRHYTQLVWADSYLLGCARAIFQQSNGSSVAYKEHLVCNYGPTGNIPDQPVYRIGKACSECQQGTTCSTEYSALCAAELNDDLYDYLASDRTKLTTSNTHLVLFACFISNLYCFYLDQFV
ncbi:PREDICTED: venom allergen 3-like [Nicrophorus vespilloides]|uniref:Venom allergen 3-like n=1 Tax=Nicrophorus vespilloides TaxID=110193 RepID=A0ABM1M0M2_NICVS|nr:PREDICTED: venom allergen 3-like [Nicrophorus vespilloides]